MHRQAGVPQADVASGQARHAEVATAVRRRTARPSLLNATATRRLTGSSTVCAMALRPACRAWARELPPGRAQPPWSRTEPASTQERADRRRRDPDPELGQLAPDPHARHRGFSLPIRRVSSPTSSASGGLPPVAFRRWVHFLRTSSRCQRSSVCGLTTNEDQRGRGRTRLAAAINSRSRRRRRGLPTWRLSTAS
jgi:hypothetical protein